MNIKLSEIKHSLEQDILERTKSLQREKWLKVIQEHGIKDFKTQTACINGEYVKSGSSFDENLGIKEFYTIKEVKEWLGY